MRKMIGSLMSVCLCFCTEQKFGGNEPPTEHIAVANLPKDYILADYPQEEQLKIIFAQALKTLFHENPQFKTYFIENELVKNSTPVEFLYQQHKHNTIGSTGKTFENMILSSVKDDAQRAFLHGQLEKVLPNLVIQIPQWTAVIFKENGFNGLTYAIYVQLTSRADNAFSQKHDIPIQIKESERLLLLRKGTNTTIWGDDFTENHFPALKNCTNFDRTTYVVYSDEVYDYLDKVRLNNDLLFGKICH